MPPKPNDPKVPLGLNQALRVLLLVTPVTQVRFWQFGFLAVNESF